MLEETWAKPTKTLSNPVKTKILNLRTPWGTLQYLMQETLRKLRNFEPKSSMSPGSFRPNREIRNPKRQTPNLYMGTCQNYGPFLGTINIRCRIIISTQKGTLILTTTHKNHRKLLNLRPRRFQAKASIIQAYLLNLYTTPPKNSHTRCKTPVEMIEASTFCPKLFIKPL